MTRARRRIHGQRAGVLLDAVVAFGVIVVGAYALSHLGITFRELLNGASAFFGV